MAHTSSHQEQHHGVGMEATALETALTNYTLPLSTCESAYAARASDCMNDCHVENLAGLAETSVTEESIRAVCKKYRSRLGDVLEIEQLSGGLINSVFRIVTTKNNNAFCDELKPSIDRDSTATSGRSETKDELRSYVVKHFPPYLSSDPSIPFSQQRYYAERNGLKIAQLLRTSLVFVPDVVVADDESFTLIMEDAGDDLVSLFDYFRRDIEVSTLTLSVEEIAVALVNYLHHLHGLEITTKLLHSIAESEEAIRLADCVFDHPLSRKMVIDYVYGCFGDRVTPYGTMDDWIPRVAKYAEEMSEELLIVSTNTPRRLVFGDLWPSSIFIDPLSHRLVLLDWEFCQYGRSSRDIYQLFSYLWLMEQDSTYCTEDVTLFRECMMKHFQSISDEQVLEWDLVTFAVNFAMALDDDRWNFSHPVTKIVEKTASMLAKSFKSLEEPA